MSYTLRPRYRLECFWWELVIFAERLSLNAAIVLFDAGSVVQFSIGLTIIFVSTVGPFIKRSHARSQRRPTNHSYHSQPPHPPPLGFVCQRFFLRNILLVISQRLEKILRRNFLLKISPGRKKIMRRNILLITSPRLPRDRYPGVTTLRKPRNAARQMLGEIFES